MTKYYEVVGENQVVKNTGTVCGQGSQVPDDEIDADTLKALIADGTLVEISGTDTGKTPAKEPHPEQVMTKVIEPTVKKGGRK